MSATKGKLCKADPISASWLLEAGLLVRLAEVRKYMIDKRKKGSYIPVFTALEPELSQHSRRIHKLFNGDARVKVTDAPIISKMEKVIQQLSNAA